MTASKPPGWDARIVAWLQGINGQYSTALRWIALAGIVYGAVLGRADLVASFTGLAVLPNVVGKPPP